MGHLNKPNFSSESSSDQEVINLKKENKKLRAALANVIEATEDKNGQFRAWHNHLRETTKNAKELLNSSEEK